MVTSSRPRAPVSAFCESWNSLNLAGSVTVEASTLIWLALARASVTCVSASRSCAAWPFTVSTVLVLHIQPLRLRAFVIGRDVVDATARKQRSGEHGDNPGAV